MLIYASSVLHPSSRMLLMAESMVMYDKEKSPFGMPSLTLWSAGWDKSIHLFGWRCFGMTLNQLMCM